MQDNEHVILASNSGSNRQKTALWVTVLCSNITSTRIFTKEQGNPRGALAITLVS